jgi:hypothetical protein
MNNFSFDLKTPEIASISLQKELNAFLNEIENGQNRHAIEIIKSMVIEDSIKENVICLFGENEGSWKYDESSAIIEVLKNIPLKFNINFKGIFEWFTEEDAFQYYFDGKGNVDSKQTEYNDEEEGREGAFEPSIKKNTLETTLNKELDNEIEVKQHLISFSLFYSSFLDFNKKKGSQDDLEQLITNKIFQGNDKEMYENFNIGMDFCDKIREGIKTYEEGFKKIEETISTLKINDNQINNFIHLCIEMYLFTNSENDQFTGDEIYPESGEFYKGFENYSTFNFFETLNNGIKENKVVEILLKAIKLSLENKRCGKTYEELKDINQLEKWKLALSYYDGDDEFTPKLRSGEFTTDELWAFLKEYDISEKKDYLTSLNLKLQDLEDLSSDDLKYILVNCGLFQDEIEPLNLGTAWLFANNREAEKSDDQGISNESSGSSEEPAKEIVKNIDGDQLTDILEPFVDNVYDEIILLDITSKELSAKNYDNIQQVGYKATYGDEDEVNKLILYYYKKCVEWYDRDYYSFGSNESLTPEEAAKEESGLIIEDEKDNGNTTLALLYCEGIYVWSVGG